MFSFFKKKEKPHALKAPVAGQSIPLYDVEDEAFRSGLLGEGVGIRPTDHRFVAPADGVVEMVFSTKHAVSLRAATGEEILLHIGLNTVNAQGEGFTAHVKTGDTVHQGDLLLEADLAQLQANGYDTTTVLIICNPDAFGGIEAQTDRELIPGEDLLLVHTK